MHPNLAKSFSYLMERREYLIDKCFSSAITGDIANYKIYQFISFSMLNIRRRILFLYDIDTRKSAAPIIIIVDIDFCHNCCVVGLKIK
jgi:hypothetical protein